MESNSFENKKKILISHRLLFTLLSGAFALGIFIGTGVGVFTPLPSAKDKSAPGSAEGTFKFIRSSLEAKAPEEKGRSKELKPFKYKVNSLIELALKTHDAAALSVTFRDLNTGNRFGIRERENFLDNSQWSLPLMIAYFKWAETNPLLLRKTLTCAGAEGGAEQNHGVPLERLVPGRSYAVGDLIYRMIAYDDPASYALLYANLPKKRLEKIFKDLDVDYDPNKKNGTLSLNSFAAFYRVLFNASYLSEEMSEKALRYLSQSTFRDGMVSGIPQNIDIASKHGERAVSAEGRGQGQSSYQLHEFGIVYHPRRPFLLGIMARGDDVDNLMKVVREITRLVYDEVDRQS